MPLIDYHGRSVAMKIVKGKHYQVCNPINNEDQILVRCAFASTGGSGRWLGHLGANAPPAASEICKNTFPRTERNIKNCIEEKLFY